MGAVDRSGSRWLFVGLAAFFVAGLGMLLGGLYAGWSTARFIRGAARAPGHVLGYDTSRSDDGGVSYYPRVEFEPAPGRKVEFRSQVGGNSRPYGVGQQVDVLYDPRDPRRAEINATFTLWFLPGVLGVLGLGFAGLSSAMFLILRGADRAARAAEARRAEAAERLRACGRKVTARVDQVVRDTSYRRDGRRPYRILARWLDPATREVRLFESDRIWFDPEEYLAETIAVYIDPDDADTYFVDTSILPRLAG